MAPGGWVPPHCSLSLGPRPRHLLGLWRWVPSCRGEQTGAGSEEGPKWGGQGDSAVGTVTEGARPWGRPGGARSAQDRGATWECKSSGGLLCSGWCRRVWERPPRAWGGTWGQPTSATGGEHTLGAFSWKENPAGEGDYPETQRSAEKRAAGTRTWRSGRRPAHGAGPWGRTQSRKRQSTPQCGAPGTALLGWGLLGRAHWRRRACVCALGRWPC